MSSGLIRESLDLGPDNNAANLDDYDDFEDMISEPESDLLETVALKFRSTTPSQCSQSYCEPQSSNLTSIEVLPSFCDPETTDETTV